MNNETIRKKFLFDLEFSNNLLSKYNSNNNHHYMFICNRDSYKFIDVLKTSGFKLKANYIKKKNIKNLNRYFTITLNTEYKTFYIDSRPKELDTYFINGFNIIPLYIHNYKVGEVND